MLAKNARVVCVGTLSGEMAEINGDDPEARHNQRLIRRLSKETYEKILRLFVDGTFEPVIDSVLPVEETKAAHERIEAKLAFGKIVLVRQAHA